MIKNVEMKNQQAMVTYEFSEQDMEILRHLKEHNYMEFRRGENSAIVDNLYDYGFVTTDDDAWHFTVVLTKLGKAVVESWDK
ncbi:hypothetical protein CVD28_00565 [Bacillus sp. M6-12]|uniref:hypothetical protein n=1 Tax=Bacillus sp. M6-12 TaxID=2054166 RepID=UPI000C761763|nr:hypothetical protein [Bacillus sp. M6-12]PLS18927.1 hypothetical protein CVD28_00565 [Bacillus sp. M6-12]